MQFEIEIPENERPRAIIAQGEVLQGVQDLYYFDEAGFSLTPSVPYGWQPIGERVEIPSAKSAAKRIGFSKLPR